MRIKAFTLIEILVVVSIFAFLGILITRSVLLTVSGSRKSESLVKIRENLDYSVSVIDRQLRNANSIVLCPNPNPSVINYVDQDGNAASFSCSKDANGNGYVASASAVPASSTPLTGSNVDVINCSLVCQPGVSANPPSVIIKLTAIDSTATGVQNAEVTISAQVSLRNY